MPFSIRHLRAFVSVADHGSVNRAATALLRAQSAVTRSIHELERELGAALFERRPRGMLLTESGRALLLRACRAQGEMQVARKSLASIAGPKSRIRNAPLFALFATERRLQAFVALTEQHHMHSVAEGLGISQPAVSIAIRQLEESIGVPLFDRSPKGMLPNESGVLLALHVKRALTEVRSADAEIAALNGVTRGTVRVGALPLGRTRLLPAAVARLLRRHPGLQVATVEGSFEFLAAALRSGDVDFILGALRPAEYASDLAGEALLEDRLAVVARRGHPLADAKPGRKRHDSGSGTGSCKRGKKPKPIAFAAIARYDWVLPRKGAPTRDLFEKVLAARGHARPNISVETSDLAVLRGVLLESDMLTAISPRQLHYELEAGLLAVVPVSLPETRRQIGITQRTDSHPSPAARLLMEEIRGVCASGSGK